MKILITGGAGFIGSNLCVKLCELGHEIHVIDNLAEQVHGDIKTSYSYNLIKNKVNFLNYDVSNSLVWDFLSGSFYDIIICLAAETGTGQSMYQAYNCYKTNVDSLAILNDAIISNKIKTNKIILASSRAVYGDAICDIFGEPKASLEKDEVNPFSIYASSKYAQEQIIKVGFKNVPFVILRFQNVYGNGQSLNNPYTGIISIFSNAIKNNKNINIFEDGMMSRDFVHVFDVVDSILLSCEQDIKNQIFNVGSGERITVLEVAQKLKELYKSDVKIEITGEKRVGDIRHNFADISKIKSIGYLPKINFENGLKMFKLWVDNYHNLSYNNYHSSLDELRVKGLLTK
jgi:dTDP-L-rhamnose 4-epimerase